jgi:hypothetical protein
MGNNSSSDGGYDWSNTDYGDWSSPQNADDGGWSSFQNADSGGGSLWRQWCENRDLPSSSTNDPLDRYRDLLSLSPNDLLDRYPIGMICIFNTLRKLIIIPLSLTLSSFTPVIVSVLGDFEHMTHTCHGKEMAMLVDERIFHGWGCVKMPNAFLRFPFPASEFHFPV